MAYINGKEILFSPTINISGGSVLDILEFTYSPKKIYYPPQANTKTVTVNLSWRIYGTPTSLKLTGTGIDESGITLASDATTYTHTYTFDLKIDSEGNYDPLMLNPQFTLTAKDANGNTATKTIRFSYAHGENIYWGVGTVEGTEENPFTSDIKYRLAYRYQDSRAFSFTVNPNKEYIYFAAPVSYCSGIVFTVNGWQGGFNEPQTIKIDNIDYYIYRSTNKLTGSIPINVT